MTTQPEGNQIDLDDFNVENKKLFSKFLLERNKWLDWFAGDVAHLIDRGYVNLQATSIRSLIDRREDVVSLFRMIKNWEKNVGLITRKIMFVMMV